MTTTPVPDPQDNAPEKGAAQAPERVLHILSNDGVSTVPLPPGARLEIQVGDHRFLATLMPDTEGDIRFVQLLTESKDEGVRRVAKEVIRCLEGSCANMHAIYGGRSA